MLVYLVLLAPIDLLVISPGFRQVFALLLSRRFPSEPWNPWSISVWDCYVEIPSTSTCISTTGRTLDFIRSILVLTQAECNRKSTPGQQPGFQRHANSPRWYGCTPRGAGDVGHCGSCPLPMVVNKSFPIFWIQVPGPENPLQCSVSFQEWSELSVSIFPLIQFLSTPIQTNQTDKRRLFSIQIVLSTFVQPSFLFYTSQVPVLTRP